MDYEKLHLGKSEEITGLQNTEVIVEDAPWVD